MMKTMIGRIGGLVAVAVLALWPAAQALAQERGTPAEAQAMAERAAELLRTQGAEAAFAAFQVPGAPFHDRDLYVFVVDSQGVMRVHPNAALVGQTMLARQDPQGRAYIRDFVAIQDHGWVDYSFEDPQTHQILPKTSYIVRVGDYRVGVGAYRPQ